MRALAAVPAIVGWLCGALPSRAEPAPPLHAIVFVSPHSDELEASVRDALTAQLAGTHIEVAFERFSSDGAPLRNEVSEAKSLASAHDAVGVFWLDTQTDREWLVYLSEPQGERVLVRRLVVDPGGLGAAAEAVAVITRQSSEALIAGETIGMRPVDLPPEPAVPAALVAIIPPPPVVRPRPFERPHGLSLSLSYQGDSPAKEIAWQSGLRLGATYRARRGLYAGAGYVLYRPSLVETGGIAFEVARSPFDLEGGFAFGHGRWVPSVELKGIFELVHRHDVSTTAPFSQAPDATRAVVFLSPRVRLGYTLSPVSEIYLGGGVDVALNGFSFVSQADGQEHVLLDPLRIRPSVEVGCSFWP